MIECIKLALTALLPAGAALLIFLMQKRNLFHRIPQIARNVGIGILFGILSIIGTEMGVPMNGAQINFRDAAVLIAGLLFGAPSGLIAGFIGGTERWIAGTYWGIGTFTTTACTLATYLAGIFSALVSHFVLERKKPTCGMALFITVTVEVFHMMMVFLTNLNDASRAIGVVRSCTIPMVLANGISVLAAVFCVSMAAHEKSFFLFKKRSETPLFEIIQHGMLAVITVCLIITCFFVFTLENNLSTSEANYLLSSDITDTAAELDEQVQNYMLEACHLLADDLLVDQDDMASLIEYYGICEIFVVDQNGIVTDSNLTESIGYDMTEDAKSSIFMRLLDTKTEYVQDYTTTAGGEDVFRESAGVRTENGFLLITYDADGIYRIVSEKISTLASNRHVGKSGYIIITDNSGNILSLSSGISRGSLTAWFSENQTVTSTIDKTIIAGTEYFYLAESMDEYTIWAIYPVSIANIQRDIADHLMIFLVILIFMAIYILLYMLIKKIIVDQIIRMADSLSLISSGHLDEVVNVNGNQEFTSLSSDINHTVDTLKQYSEEIAARIDKELEMASQIQISALPNAEYAFPKRSDFEIYAKMDPAKQVGGDFYDFYMTGNDDLNIMIADVSGKGIPAAMFMMRAKSTLKDLAEAGYAVNEVFTIGNDRLCSGNDAEMFVTAWQGMIHLKTGLVEFSNAGHNAPLIRHGNGSFEYLKQKRNLVLAAMEGVRYRKNELQLQPGDILLLYTDGVVEATNAANELYGDDRLLQIANSQEFSSMKEMLSVIRKDVDLFVGEAPQFDDLTMLVFKYNG